MPALVDLQISATTFIASSAIGTRVADVTGMSAAIVGGPEIGPLGQLLPQFFAKFNGGVIPESFSTAPQKIFWITKSPPLQGAVEPNVSLDWQGDPLLTPMTYVDNDKTLDDDLQYDLWGKHPTEPNRSFFLGGTALNSGGSIGRFFKLKGGWRGRLQNVDTKGYPFTYTAGAVRGTEDWRFVNIRGDFAPTVDADAYLTNGTPDIAKPRPKYWFAYCTGINQHGNFYDPYLRTNDPSSPKLVQAIAGNVTKDGGNGKVTVSIAAPFPMKQVNVGGTWTDTHNPVVGDRLTLAGTTFNGASRTDQDFNWRGVIDAILATDGAGKPTSFRITLDAGHNLPAGNQEAVGGRVYWFKGTGTHADTIQGAQSTGGGAPIYVGNIGLYRCGGSGNYDFAVLANSASSDSTLQIIRCDYDYLSIEPSDPVSGSYRLGWTGGAGAFEKIVFEAYATTRPGMTLGQTIALSANGGEGVNIPFGGVADAFASVPSRPEVKGVFTKGRPLGGSFAPYEELGFDAVVREESDVVRNAGTITDIIFTGLASIDESIPGGGRIGLMEAVTDNHGGIIDFAIIGSNVSLNQWAMEGCRLVASRTRFSYDLTPIVAGVPTASVTVRATIRDSNPVQSFTKTFSWPVNDDVSGDGTPVVMTFASRFEQPSPSASTTSASQAIGTPSADRYVIVPLTANATTPGREAGAMTVGAVASRRLVRAKAALRTNASNVSFAALYIAKVPAGANANIVFTMSGTYGALAMDAIAITGLVSDEPYSTALGSNADVGGQATMTVDIPAMGKAVLNAYYATPTNGNKHHSTLILSKSIAGSYQVRATPASGSLGPLRWEIFDTTLNVPAWVPLVTWGAFNSTTRGWGITSMDSSVQFAHDSVIEDAGSGATVMVAASFGPAS